MLVSGVAPGVLCELAESFASGVDDAVEVVDGVSGSVAAGGVGIGSVGLAVVSADLGAERGVVVVE